MDYHPWRALRGLESWRVIYRDLDPDLFGYTHTPSRTIVVEKRLRQTERRSTIAHELEHIWAGHRGCQPGRVEREIRDRCSRRLLPIAFVVDGILQARDSQSLWEFAEHTWVDLDTAEYRLENLSTAERREIDRRLTDLEPMLRGAAC